MILECFQAGLSWECILNKRESFRQAYNNFDIDRVACYDEDKIEELINNLNIIRNKLKLKATITNTKGFKAIQKEFGSFNKYIWPFTDNKIIVENYRVRTTSPLSDAISNDLKKLGMKFMGSTTIYSYLQAIGVINAHGYECDLCKRG